MKNGLKTFTCKGCNTEVYLNRQGSPRYCSKDCYHTNGKRTGRKLTGKTINCTQCSKEYYITKHRAEKDKLPFCSHTCHNTYQGRNKVNFTCTVCSESKLLSPFFGNDPNRKYCSIKCRDNDPNLKLRLRNLNLIKQKNNPSKLEILGYQIIDSCFKYTEVLKQHLLFDRFCVDTYIPSLKLVIEIDGDYWHGNTIKFPVLDHRQKRRAELDIIKDQFLKEQGITVLRFWGSDFTNKPEQVMQSINNHTAQLKLF